MATTVTQKDRERAHVGSFLRCIGEVPSEWDIHAEQERPDFLLDSPDGERIGLEMTELVSPEFGQMRTAERLVCSAIQEVLEAFISAFGIVGLHVRGNNRAVTPLKRSDLDGLRHQLEEHLEVHGHCLTSPNGSIRTPLKHPWGTVASIHVTHEPGVIFTIDRHDRTPAYKELQRTTEEIEADVLSLIEVKAKKAESYDSEYPLWLAIRNPSHGIVVRLSVTCINRARQLNGERFSRITLFNDPEHILDACPPGPHSVEIA